MNGRDYSDGELSAACESYWNDFEERERERLAEYEEEDGKETTT